MPHLTLEYSNNLAAPVDFDALFVKMAEELLAYPPIKMADIKCRAIGYDTFRIGSGDPRAVFVHLSVDIMVGRTPEQRTAMSQALLKLLKESFLAIYDSQPCDITVNIREIDRDSYGKLTNQSPRR